MNKKPTSITELCELFWYLEHKYELLDFEVDGVLVWQYMRMQLYYIIAQKTKVLTQPHTQITSKDKLRSVFSYVKNSLFCNYLTLKEKKYVFITHPRSVRIDDELIDIYTKYFIDEEHRQDNNFIELESAHLGKHLRKKNKNTHYTDWIALSQKLYSFIVKSHVDTKELTVLDQVNAEINDICKTDFDFKALLINGVRKYKSQYFIYDKVFKKIKPNKIYLVVSYGQAPVIKSAKDNGIEVVELQHGTFSEYHLGYSFPNRTKQVSYFPDKFYVWNEYWKSLIKLPIASENVKVDSFRYLEREKKKHLKTQRNKDQILVLSQGAIGNAIAEKILKHIDKFKDSYIKYKLHPGEFSRWHNYPALNELIKYENVEIVCDEIPLYKLFSQSAIQVGVFSTALYEGVEFGCETILLDLNGIEYMSKFIEMYDAKVLH